MSFFDRRPIGGILLIIFSLLAFAPRSALAQASPSVISGSIRDPAGAAVSGAIVTISGPTTQTVATDSSGSFNVTLRPGTYHIAVTRSGYNRVALSDLVLTEGKTIPVTVTVTRTDLSSLQTIGSVTSSTRGNSINAGPAAQSYLSGQAFSDFAAPQINDVLQHLPGITVQQMGSQPDRSIVVGGVQPYETQVLIDGHPLALGQYGVWVSTYFPSFLLGGVEIQSGPGNTTPFANLAVGGTANLVTPSFTTKRREQLTTGFDNYDSQYSSFLASGTAGKVGYVADFGVSGLNNAYYDKKECIVSPDGAKPGTGTIAECLPAASAFYQRGALLKAKYDFSPATSLEVGYVGAWGGYNPQNTAYGTFLGQQKIEGCQSNGYNCTNPANASLVGQTITGIRWYTSSSNYNNQALYDAQLRTSVGNTTILLRPYIGQIEPEVELGAGQSYDANFFGPPGGASFANGTPVNVSNVKGTYFLTGGGATKAATAAESNCLNAFGSVANPGGKYTVVGNQFECFYGAYSTYETDKLYGMTTSLVQPIGGDNVLGLNYDFHGQSTFAYVNNPAGVSVPFSTDRYSTFSLTGNLHLTPQLSTNIGVYDTLWSINGVQLANPSDTTSTALASLNRTVSHFDPHVAFVLRPNLNTSVRLAAGTSTTFPFVGQVSGLATYEEPSCSLGPPFADGGTLTQKNPNLKPETSIGYAAGADYKLKNNSLISVDLQQTVVHGVFEQLTTQVPVSRPTLCGTPAALEGVFFPANVARLNAKSITLKYNYSPRKGFGVNVGATAESSILSGLTPDLFTPGVPSVPANDVQICGNGVAAPGIATCIPYLQGYGQVTWAQPDGAFVGLGVDYQGKNNAYFQPPFAVADLVARKPVGRFAEVQISAQNLFSTNNYGAYLPIPGAGTPLVANTTNSSFSSQQQTSYTPSLIPAAARTLRFQLRLHTQ